MTYQYNLPYFQQTSKTVLPHKDSYIVLAEQI